MNRARIAVPMILTTRDPADQGGRAGTTGKSPGLEMAWRFAEYLDYMTYRASAAERMEQLAEVYPEAHEALRLKRQGSTPEYIGEVMGYSRRTVFRLLKKAHAYLQGQSGMGEVTAPTEEQRQDMLSVTNPRAFFVYIVTGYRWPQGQIADQLGISVDTVQRDLKLASGYIGHPPQGRIGRYSQLQAPKYGT